MPVVFRHQEPHQHEVVLTEEKGRFNVRYGKEVHTGLTYEEAGKRLGYSLLHAIACNGKLSEKALS